MTEYHDSASTANDGKKTQKITLKRAHNYWHQCFSASQPDKGRKCVAILLHPEVGGHPKNRLKEARMNGVLTKDEIKLFEIVPM